MTKRQLAWPVFRELIEIETDACIEWPMCLDHGYGVATIEGRRVRVHRAALLARQAPPSPTALALHRPELCHNKACMNYRHLYWGDNFSNAADKLVDNTHLRGGRHPLAKLTEDDVREIRAAWKPGQTSALARRYGVSRALIYSVVQRWSWAWLT